MRFCLRRTDLVIKSVGQPVKDLRIPVSDIGRAPGEMLLAPVGDQSGLAAIAELLKRYDDAESLAQALRLKRAELSDQAEKTARQRAALSLLMAPLSYFRAHRPATSTAVSTGVWKAR